MTITKRDTAVRSENHSGSIETRDTAERVSSGLESSIAYSQGLDTNSIYLSADTLYVGNNSKTFVEARYYRDGLEKDVSTTLKPNPRYDEHLNNMEVLHHYAKLFSNVETIYYTLPAVGHVGNLGHIKSKEISAPENPTTKPLAEKIKRVLKGIREENRGLYA